jgi:Phospholipase_D-nuclease N-terminal
MTQTMVTGWLLLALDVLIVLAAAVLISANRKPSAAIAWILAVIFIPVIGILLFLLVGFGKLPRSRRDKQRDVNEAMLARTEGLDQVSHRDEWPDWLASMVTMNRNLGSLPMVGGNSAELIDSYSDSIQAMADAIDTAERFIHVEFFILVADDATEPIFAALNAHAHAASTYGCCPIMSPSSCTPTAMRRSGASRPWGRTIGRCCRSSPSAVAGADLTCATTGSFSLLTASSASRARRT